MQQLEDQSSPIGAFVRERCEIGPLYLVEVEEIFGAWKTWCEAQGRDHPGTKQSFGRDLSAAVPGLTVAQLGSRGGRAHFYQGVKLKEDWNDEPTTPDF
jgi:putative DNA primase/helicase